MALLGKQFKPINDIIDFIFNWVTLFSFLIHIQWRYYFSVWTFILNNNIFTMWTMYCYESLLYFQVVILGRSDLVRLCRGWTAEPTWWYQDSSFLLCWGPGPCIFAETKKFGLYMDCTCSELFSFKIEWLS